MKKQYVLLFFLSLFFHQGSAQGHWTIPDFVVVQGAGSLGYFSAGLGYNVFKSKARFSTHYGYIPARFDGELQVLAAKLIFVPVRLTVWNRVRMNPFDIGLMGSYHYGDKIKGLLPEDEHRKGYYWWHPAFRAHLVMESSLTYEFKKNQRFTSVTGYVEFNTNELYYLNFVQNIRKVKVTDVVRVGTGVRLNF